MFECERKTIRILFSYIHYLFRKLSVVFFFSVCVLFSLLVLFIKITTSFVAIFNTICTFSKSVSDLLVEQTLKKNQLPKHKRRINSTHRTSCTSVQRNRYFTLKHRRFNSNQFNLRCSCLRNLRQTKQIKSLDRFMNT